MGFRAIPPYFGRRTAAPAKSRPRRGHARYAAAGLLAQPCRLVFPPHYGVYAAYDCVVTDVANGGYGICLIGHTRLGPEHLAGMDAYLEQPDKVLISVELRWARGPKVGLKRLPRQRLAEFLSII
jgi:hypothetical protein